MIKLKTNEWEINNIETVLFDKDGTFIDLHFFWGKMTELRAKEVIKEFNLENKYFNEKNYQKALEDCKGYLRSELAKKLKARKMPELIFKRDSSLDYGNRIEELLASIKKSRNRSRMSNS